ncbi:pyrroline-5-carboxylate reductase dimerization domain-containing protein [Shinella sp. S4-D37]|uniref:pyrroline-5-carboxylate reductase dimerization domain-containing protein n=1 Tax=Shinella sp. S4-D37 TaxID=3161999 RepID=UPI0034672E9E
MARAIIGALSFPPSCKIVSLIATIRSETLAEWIGRAGSITRAIPLPSVAELSGVTAIYPQDQVVEELFGQLGQVVAAASLGEFDGYAAASALMGTYFGLLATAAGWMVERGADNQRARAYLGSLFHGLAQTTAADERSFSDLIEAHSTPNGLNAQAWQQFRADGGAKILRDALAAVALRLENSIPNERAD